MKKIIIIILIESLIVGCGSHKLREDQGRLTIYSNPPGAIIYTNGVSGKAPINVIWKLGFGEYANPLITAKWKSGATVDTSVEVIAGKDLEYTMQRPNVSGLDIDLPTGARDSSNAVAIGVGIFLGAVIIAAARHSGSGGGYSAPAFSADTDWAWDEFYNKNRQLVWACRGIQTGEFALESHCFGKFKSDWQWPEK